MASFIYVSLEETGILGSFSKTHVASLEPYPGFCVRSGPDKDSFPSIPGPFAASAPGKSRVWIRSPTAELWLMLYSTQNSHLHLHTSPYHPILIQIPNRASQIPSTKSVSKHPSMWEFHEDIRYLYMVDGCLVFPPYTLGFQRTGITPAFSVPSTEPWALRHSGNRV